MHLPYEACSGREVIKKICHAQFLNVHSLRQYDPILALCRVLPAEKWMDFFKISHGRSDTREGLKNNAQNIPTLDPSTFPLLGQAE